MDAQGLRGTLGNGLHWRPDARYHRRPSGRNRGGERDRGNDATTAAKDQDVFLRTKNPFWADKVTRITRMGDVRTTVAERKSSPKANFGDFLTGVGVRDHDVDEGSQSVASVWLEMPLGELASAGPWRCDGAHYGL